jgi:hypothetical protein
MKDHNIYQTVNEALRMTFLAAAQPARYTTRCRVMSPTLGSAQQMKAAALTGGIRHDPWRGDLAWERYVAYEHSH